MNPISIPGILLALLFLCILRPWRRGEVVVAAEDDDPGYGPESFYYRSLGDGEIEEGEKCYQEN